MFAKVDWANLEVAGAFVLGAALGTIATIRVMRSVAMFFGASPPRRRPPGRHQSPRAERNDAGAADTPPER